MWSAWGHLGERYTHFRPRFNVRSLMIVVAVASLILSLVAYEQQLKGWARYHEARYLEHISPISAQTGSRGLMYKSRLLDGTWTVLHHKTPQAEWHEQKKWEYHTAIVRTNFFLLASLAGSVFLLLFCKAVLTKIRRAQAPNE
jgi:predicted benzoate:H+ symporter BenE